jgi:single-stranded-DNA-specific exonuclease
LLLGYGGHAMAAGLSLQAERIPEFRRVFADRTLAQSLGEQHSPASTLQIDGYLPLAELSSELVADFERLAPFGAGNPALIFSSSWQYACAATALSGRGDEHLQLDPRGRSRT